MRPFDFNLYFIIFCSLLRSIIVYYYCHQILLLKRERERERERVRERERERERERARVCHTLIMMMLISSLELSPI